MSIAQSQTQKVQAVVIPFDFRTLATEAAFQLARLVPNGALLLGGAITVSTAFDTGGTDELDFGTAADPDAYTSSPIDLTAPGTTALTGAAGVIFTGDTQVGLTRNYELTEADPEAEPPVEAGEPPTEGEGVIVLRYVLLNRGDGQYQ